MRDKILGMFIVLVIAVAVVLTGCAPAVPSAEVNEAEFNQIFEFQRAAYAGELNPAEYNAFAAEFNEEYGTDLEYLPEGRGALMDSNLEPLWDMTFDYDGALYIYSMVPQVDAILNIISPHATEYKFNHGSFLDLDQFNPNDLDQPCLYTANPTNKVSYQTPLHLMKNPAVAEMRPVDGLNASLLNEAQTWMEAERQRPDKEYGFFEDMAKLWSPTTKDDDVWTYCTKVCWSLYDRMGIDIDSNSSQLDFTECAVYDVAKAYFYTRYLFNWRKASRKLTEYMALCREELVTAEEIWFSPELEVINVWDRD